MLKVAIKHKLEIKFCTLTLTPQLPLPLHPKHVKYPDDEDQLENINFRQAQSKAIMACGNFVTHAIISYALIWTDCPNYPMRIAVGLY